ncbi:hypothetical protein HSBAA_30440 [Vreelandella sulfidaeris]|uniref:Uncharacterized protein n=1 Tax=Vreelandella sulfidaeris TaxID=115553 RepID=A0A455UBR5_9GAMM|nr:hypothetical protein HSBAA_30440 [Halomonas sulfidaeris]
MEASENEIKLSILARKHLHKLSAASGMVARDAVVARERALDQRLADRGLLN